MHCLKTYIGRIVWGADFEHCGGSNGVGVDKSCRGSCSQFCESVHQVAERKHEIFDQWGLSKDEIKKVNKELIS